MLNVGVNYDNDYGNGNCYNQNVQIGLYLHHHFNMAIPLYVLLKNDGIHSRVVRSYLCYSAYCVCLGRYNKNHLIEMTLLCLALVFIKTISVKTTLLQTHCLQTGTNANLL